MALDRCIRCGGVIDQVNDDVGSWEATTDDNGNDAVVHTACLTYKEQAELVEDFAPWIGRLVQFLVAEGYFEQKHPERPNEFTLTRPLPDPDDLPRLVAVWEREQAK